MFALLYKIADNQEGTTNNGKPRAAITSCGGAGCGWESKGWELKPTAYENELFKSDKVLRKQKYMRRCFAGVVADRMDEEARAARACAPFGQRLVALLTLPLVLRACLCLLSLVACLSRLFPVARPSCLLFSPSPLFLDGLSVSRCYPRLFLSRARALCGLSGPQRHPAQEPRVRHEHCYACQLWQRQQLSAHPTPV
jgi:hypothetical protein